jgi:hypothetical protein
MFGLPALWHGLSRQKHPSAAKAEAVLPYPSARLKPCPFKTRYLPWSTVFMRVCIIPASQEAESDFVAYESPDFRKQGDSSMKLWIAVAVLFCAPLCASAQIKSCDDLKTEIAKKLDAKGVMNYTLTIVDKGKETEGKIVGSCGGGTKSIVYLKATPAPEPKPTPKPKPAAQNPPK